MGLLSRLFGRSGDDGRRLERELRELEQQADRAHPGFDAPLFNRAGDLCLDAGLSDRALEYYGRGIDAYLRAGRYDAAAGVCRKLLRVAPNAVRARCTLAWLAIGKGHQGDARAEVEAYVAAARRARQEPIAIRQLRMMGEVVFDEELWRVLSEQLHALGETAGSTAATPPAVAPASAEDREALWARVLQAALMGPRELRG
jgi:tetratricopeptide (TPR) repeat protein